jgi:hypothetical protein
VLRNGDRAKGWEELCEPGWVESNANPISALRFEFKRIAMGECWRKFPAATVSGEDSGDRFLLLEIGAYFSWAQRTGVDLGFRDR